MFTALLRFFSPDSAPAARAQEVYIALSRQSRNPFFFTECGVADTLDGRFDMLVLHVFLGGGLAHGAPLLLEAFFADMDRSLREMGVGDTGVSRRMRAMSEAAFGRLKAYDDAWDDDAALREALLRNVYRARKPAPEALDKLMYYMRHWRMSL